jgi:hypothetical protein
MKLKEIRTRRALGLKEKKSAIPARYRALVFAGIA